ncbi:NB-ARC domain-containing protein [Actinacidiphila sp. bgisy145]|uniref:NB-ARC domain-containing protein n=1 Tax=Actinacidiphila sp. bgisy145 TaxID=3413792 RepID=UPI003EBD2D1B
MNDRPAPGAEAWTAALHHLWEASGRTGWASIDRAVNRRTGAPGPGRPDARPRRTVSESTWYGWLEGTYVPRSFETLAPVLDFLAERAERHTPGFRRRPRASWERLWRAARAGRRPRTAGPDPARAPADPRLHLPAEYLARPDLHERAVAAVGAADPGAEPPTRTPVVALVGMGGAGKSVLARAVALDPRVARRFRDGVLWLPADGRSADACRGELLAALDEPATGADPAAGLPALRDRLRTLDCLVVVDNVTSAEQLLALDVFGPGSALLTTTRDLETVPHGCRPILVETLPAEPARHLLAAYARVAPDELPGAAGQVLGHCRGLPLALAICGAMAAEGHSWTGLADALDRPRPDALVKQFLDYRHGSLTAAIRASTDALPEVVRACYEDLAVFAARGPVPVAAVELVWRHRGLDDADVLSAVELLARRCLLTHRPEDGTVLQHDLLQDHSCHAARRRRAELHDRLAADLARRWGGLDKGLPGLAHPVPADDLDRYALVHLGGHFAAAGQADLLHRLLAAASGAHGGTNTWFAAHDRAGLVREYLADLERARGLAASATDRADPGAGQDAGMALEIRYELIRSSIVTRAATVPAALLVALVRQGVWTFRQAEAYTGLMPDPVQRSEAYRRLAAATGLPPRRRAHLLGLAIRAAERIPAPVQRTNALIRLLGLVDDAAREALLERALAAADADRQRSGEIRAAVFAAASPWFPERAQRELLAGLRQGEDRHHFREVLHAALPALPELLDDVLEVARTGDGFHERTQALRAALRVAAPDVREQLIAWRLTAERSAPELRGGRGLVAEELAPYLGPGELTDLVDRELPAANVHAAAAILAASIPRLTGPRRDPLVTKATALLRAGKPETRHRRWTALVRALPEPERTAVLEERVDDLFRTAPATAVDVVAACASFASGRLLRRAAAHVLADGTSDGTLELLAPHLTRDELAGCLSSARRGSRPDTWSRRPAVWARALARLTPGRPPEVQLRMLGEIAALVDGDELAALLYELAPRLDAAALGAAARAVPAAADARTTALVLARLAARAQDPDDRAALLRRAREAAYRGDREGVQRPVLARATTPGELLAALGPGPSDRGGRSRQSPGPGRLSDAQAEAALGAARALHDVCDRACALAALAGRAAPDRAGVTLHEALTTVLLPHGHVDAVYCPGLDVVREAAERCSGAASPDRTFAACAALLDPGNQVWRLAQLGCLLALVPASQCLPAVAETLERLAEEDIGTEHHDDAEGQLLGALDAVGPHLDDAARRQALRVARKLSPEGETEAYALLAATAEPLARAELLAMVTGRLREQTAVLDHYTLVRIIPWLGERDAADLVGRLLRRRAADRRWLGAFPYTVAALAPHLTPALLDQIAGVVARHPVFSERAEAHADLALAASTVLPERRPAFWRAAVADAAAVGRSALLGLIARLPLDGRPELTAPLLAAVLDVRRWWPDGHPADPPPGPNEAA